MRRKLSTVAILFMCIATFAQTKQEIYAVAFYNVENLFDTKNDPKVNDGEYTPEGDKKWDQEKYQKKLNNMAYVLAQLGKDHTPDGAAIIGLAEVENRNVLIELNATGKLAPMGYKIVHHDSPDERGIDVALLYNPKLFKLSSTKVYPYKMSEKPDFKTRDQLLVSGTLAGESFHVIVNHWPSRLGEKSSELREFAASISKHISDSIYKANPKAKIVIMGDLNDDPQDKSCRLILNAKKNESEVQKGGLFNPMWAIYDSGKGSLCYKGDWNLFDQIIVSESLINKKSNLSLWKAEIFDKEFLIQQEGKYKGYPLRTFSGNTFMNGYSDHLPTIIYLKKK